MPPSGSGPPSRSSPPSTVRKGRLRVHDPFELVRWLALSQTDPRKALAELVQNSLDAGARAIRITRVRLKKTPCLRIWDDGEGVIPELDRVEALKYIATHVGHSRKRRLTPRERLELMTQGRYGIGLLGFWSLGQTLELRSSIPGQRAHRLVLHRDSPEYAIEPLRGRLPFDERWTEIVVAGLHREAMPMLTCRRVSDFLASELRGQLLSREVRIEVFDRVARGRAPKELSVRPRRFLGERIVGLDRIELPDFAPIRLELYFAGDGGAPGEGDAESRGLAVYSAGSLVVESFGDLMSLGLDHSPWTDPRLSGFVDFPDFSVAPGSRRGIVLDRAAGAFARALLDVEPTLEELLAGYDRRLAEELDRNLIRELQRAFRGLYRTRPGYSLLPVAEGAGSGDGAGAAGTPAAGELVAPEKAAERVSPEPAWPPVADLFPPGPLAAVQLRPRRLRLPCGGSQRLHADALDESGRSISDGLTWEWRLDGPIGRFAADASRSSHAELLATDEPAEGRVLVEVRQGDRAAAAEAAVEVSDDSRSDEGIPEPELVDQPAAAWRSRFVDDRWQVNSGHPEYRRIADRPALKLRYLALLFAKEVVLRSSRDPRLERPLEQLVEVAAYADCNLADRRGGRKRKRASGETRGSTRHGPSG